MSNFAFNNPAFQQQDPRNVATYPGGPQAAQGAQAASFQHAGVDAATNAQLEGMYAAPPAGAIENTSSSLTICPGTRSSSEVAMVAPAGVSSV